MKIFYNTTSPKDSIVEKMIKRGTAQWRYGARHISLAIQNHHPFSLFDRIQHLVLGVLECIPLIGLGVVIADYVVNR